MTDLLNFKFNNKNNKSFQILAAKPIPQETSVFWCTACPGVEKLTPQSGLHETGRPSRVCKVIYGFI